MYKLLATVYFPDNYHTLGFAVLAVIRGYIVCGNGEVQQSSDIKEFSSLILIL